MKVKKIFNGSIPCEYEQVEKVLKDAERSLNIAIKNHAVQPYHYEIINSLKSQLYDLIVGE